MRNLGLSSIGDDKTWEPRKLLLRESGSVELGSLIYEFLVGEAPFEDAPTMTQRRIARGEMTIPSYVGKEAKNLIQRVSIHQK